jgi:hypothetical protein
MRYETTRTGRLASAGSKQHWECMREWDSQRHVIFYFENDGQRNGVQIGDVMTDVVTEVALRGRRDLAPVLDGISATPVVT